MGSTLLGTIMDWPSFVLSLVLGFIFLLLFFHFLLYSRPSLFPPGPPSLPLLGAYPFLSGNGTEKYFGPEVCSFGPVQASMLAPTLQLSSTTGPLPRVSLQKRSFVAVSTTSQQIGLDVWVEKVLGSARRIQTR